MNSTEFVKHFPFLLWTEPRFLKIPTYIRESVNQAIVSWKNPRFQSIFKTCGRYIYIIHDRFNIAYRYISRAKRKITSISFGWGNLHKWCATTSAGGDKRCCLEWSMRIVYSIYITKRFSLEFFMYVKQQLWHSTVYVSGRRRRRVNDAQPHPFPAICERLVCLYIWKDPFNLLSEDSATLFDETLGLCLLYTVRRILCADPFYIIMQMQKMRRESFFFLSHFLSSGMSQNFPSHLSNWLVESAIESLSSWRQLLFLCDVSIASFERRNLKKNVSFIWQKLSNVTSLSALTQHK